MIQKTIRNPQARELVETWIEELQEYWPQYDWSGGIDDERGVYVRGVYEGNQFLEIRFARDAGQFLRFHWLFDAGRKTDYGANLWASHYPVPAGGITASISGATYWFIRHVEAMANLHKAMPTFPPNYTFASAPRHYVEDVARLGGLLRD